MKYTLIYFSPNGETKKVNDYYKNSLLNVDEYDITAYKNRTKFNFNPEIEFLILSFPVYSQDIPPIIKEFIKKLKGKYAVVNTTFGSISQGIALRRAANILKKNGFKIIATAAIPTNHCYIANKLSTIPEVDSLSVIINKIKSDNFNEIKISFQYKNILASIFPQLRSRIGVKKIKVHYDLCISCNKCLEKCPVNAINKYYEVKHNCIRCMRCIQICPQKAREPKFNFILTNYLHVLHNRYSNNIITI